MGRPIFSPGKEWAGPFFPGEKTDWGEIPACYTGAAQEFFQPGRVNIFRYALHLLWQCHKLGAHVQDWTLFHLKRLSIIVNDDFLEEGECYGPSL